MKRYFFLLAVVLFILCSCGKRAEFPFTEAKKTFLYGNFRYFVNDEEKLVCEDENGEISLLCYDPLCPHAEDSACTAVAGHDTVLCVVEGENGAPCVYFTSQRLHFGKEITFTYEIRRLDTGTGTITVLYGDQSERIGDLYLFGDTVYFRRQTTETDGAGNIIGYGMNFFRMDPDGSHLRQITDYHGTSMTLNSIEEENGKTVFYWTDYDTETLYRSDENTLGNPDASEAVLSGASLFGGTVLNGYFYYQQKTGTVSAELSVPADPGDRNAKPDGTVTVREPTALYRYCRIRLETGAEPEILFDGMKVSNSAQTFAFIDTDGKNAYCILYAPVYLGTVTAGWAAMTGDTVRDAVHASQTDYIVSNSGGIIVKIDLTTTKTTEIPTPELDVENIIGVQRGELLVSGNSMNLDEIRESVKDGALAFPFFVPKTVRIPLP